MTTTKLKDPILASVVIGIILVAAMYFDAFEGFTAWARRSDRWQVDELLFLPVLLVLALIFVRWRKYGELQREVAERKRADAYDDNGTYTVTVTVTEEGAGTSPSDSATFQVSVDNVAPEAIFNAPESVGEGSGIDVSLTNPSDPSPADAQAGFEYAFKCGNADYGEFGVSSNATCQTVGEGDVTVRGRVRDKDYGEREYEDNVKVMNVAPTIRDVSNDGPIDEASAATITVDATDPGDDALSYEFDCNGDGDYEDGGDVGPQPDEAAECAFSLRGNHAVNVRVSDGDGGEATGSTEVRVDNVAPTLSDIPDQTTDENTATGEIAFTVGDAGTPAGDLAVSASSSNTTLVPETNIEVGGTGPERAVELTPAENRSGTAQITVSVNDGAATTGSFVLAVDPVNDRPTVTATPAELTVDEGADAQSITLAGSDLETGAPDLRFTIMRAPTDGVLKRDATVLGDGDTFTGSPADVTYRPDANFSGPDSFDFKVTDRGDPDGCGAVGQGCSGPEESEVGTVTIEVSPVDQEPVAKNDAYETNEDEDFRVAASRGVLANDEDPRGGDLEAVLVEGPSHGTLTLRPGGSFVYRPSGSFNGTDSFTYKASNGTDERAGATVTLTVLPVNDPPRATDDTKAVDENGSLVFPASDLTANDSKGPSDESDQELTVGSVGGPVRGTVDLSGGEITFVPSRGYSGPASFEYTVCDDGTTAGEPDPGCDTGKVRVTVHPINHDPTITTMSNRVIEEDESTGRLAFTVGDPDAPARALAVTAKSSKQGLVPDVSIVARGTGADRTVEATPAPNANSGDGGDATITLEVRDGDGGVATSSFRLKVRPVNDRLGFTRGADPSVTEDSGVREFPAWATGITPGPANESHQKVSFEVGPDTGAGGAMFSERPRLSPDGTLVFKPADNANGEANFVMRLVDNGGRARGGENASDEQRFKITIHPENDLPMVEMTSGAKSAKEGQTKTYTYKVEDIDEPNPLVESCGARGERIDTPAKNSFGCFFPDGPATSRVSVGVGTLTDGSRATASGDRGALTVRIANVAPQVSLSGPSVVKEGQTKGFRFTINDPGDDTFSFVAGYPKCGEGVRLVSKKIGANGGIFRCKFHRGPALGVVLLQVEDSNGALSNKAARGVMVTGGAARGSKTPSVAPGG